MTPSIAYSQRRICKIKYGEKLNENKLERKFFRQELPDSIKIKYGFVCYQIGVEHDENKKPLREKPIYACCQNDIPSIFQSN